MKFKSHGLIKGSPEFEVCATSGPVGVKAAVEGSGKAVLGPFDATVGEIPIRVRIPFLRGRGGVRRVASIGGFGVRLDPFEVAAEGFGVRFDGVLGIDGMRCDLKGAVACKMEMDLSGDLPGKVAKASLELADGEDLDLQE